MPNPLDNPELYDFFLLAGQKSPGLCDVAGAGTPRTWDERKGYGLSGATIVYTGDGLAKFGIKIKLYTTEDFAAWDTFKLLLKKTPRGVRPKAMDISHPLLEELGITSVVVEDLLQGVQTADGEWTYEVKLKQYRAPLPTIGKPDGSASKADQPTAQTEIDKTIDALTKQVKGLSS